MAGSLRPCPGTFHNSCPSHPPELLPPHPPLPALMAITANHAAPRPEETSSSSSDAEESEMRDLEELLSKLNPMAEEFVPPSLATSVAGGPGATALAPVPVPLSPAAYRYYHAKATAARGALAGAVFPLASSSRLPRGSPTLVDPPQISRPPMPNLLAPRLPHHHRLLHL